jgi:hypothetical protein
VGAAVVFALVVSIGGAFAWKATHKSCLDRTVDALNASTYSEISGGDDSRIKAEVGDCVNWSPTAAESAEMRSRIDPSVKDAMAARAKKKLDSVARAIQ